MRQESIILSIFVAITGSLILPIIPDNYMKSADTIFGRTILLSTPLLMAYLNDIPVGVMTGVVAAMALDRSHDRINTKPKGPSVIKDLSPDYTSYQDGEIVILENHQKGSH